MMLFLGTDRRLGQTVGKKVAAVLYLRGAKPTHRSY